MKYRILGLLIAVALTTGLISGCSNSGVMNYSRLVDDLKAGGYAVQTGGEVSQAFFSVKGKIIKIINEDVQVFEYKDETTMKAEASQVSSDGGSVGTSMVTWMSVPHFYKAGKLIVIYIGENAVVKGALEKVIGAQFAGK